MFIESGCLTLLHVEFGRLFAFGHKVCEPEDRAFRFSDETTSSPSLSGSSNHFNWRHAPSAAGKIGC